MVITMFRVSVGPAALVRLPSRKTAQRTACGCAQRGSRRHAPLLFRCAERKWRQRFRTAFGTALAGGTRRDVQQGASPAIGSGAGRGRAGRRTIAPGGDAHVLVVPRLGTISPWSPRPPTSRSIAACPACRASSAAWPITCKTENGKALTGDERAALLPLLHDRMTESVLDRASTARRKRSSATARRSRWRRVDVLEGRQGRAGDGQPRAGPGAVRRRDRLSGRRTSAS